ncbi:hypothetical protein ACRW9N_11635 [Listeria aquatica]|uniref:hypothetical protein n=1 Tax=Listeria aquatica TaxID=1494960 RepID=UPI003EFA2A97
MSLYVNGKLVSSTTLEESWSPMFGGIDVPDGAMYSPGYAQSSLYAGKNLSVGDVYKVTPTWGGDMYAVGVVSE